MVNVYNLYRVAPAADVPEQSASMNNFPAAVLDPNVRFADVADTSWYAASNNSGISNAVALGALETDEYMCFRPEENLSVAEVIKAAVVIHRTYNGEQGLLAEGDNWADAYAAYALEHGIITEGMLSFLDRDATRQETAYILYAALPDKELLPVNEVKTITDMTSASLYYDRVFRFAQAGIISWTTPEQDFNPERLVTRAEISTMINKLVHPSMRGVS